MQLDLTDDELTDLLAAIDSHLYWQVADSNTRNNGAVLDDAIAEDSEEGAELARFRDLEAKLETAVGRGRA